MTASPVDRTPDEPTCIGANTHCAMTARVADLLAEVGRLERERAILRTNHELMTLRFGRCAEHCRNSPGPCFCGCHVSEACGGNGSKGTADGRDE